MSRTDRGSAALETVLLTPVLAFGFVFVVWAGRGGQSTAKVEHAADRGARAAALVSRARMAATGRASALAELSANGADCTAADAGVTVLADRVVVTVRCVPNRQEMGVLPGTVVTATSSEPIDRYRGAEP